jgi:hypothetical protein
MTLLHKLADEAAAPDGYSQVSFVSALHELRVGLFRYSFLVSCIVNVHDVDMVMY